MSNNLEYSVVIPVYNSQNTIEELVKRLTDVFSRINPNYEIILIDDGSGDDSWDVMKKIHLNYLNVKIIRLMKNYGQHNATLCGFGQSNGKYIITLDDDLQNPPEEIPKLLDGIKRGYFVVFGYYSSKKTTITNRILSNFFQKLIRHVFKLPKMVTTSSFSVYHRSVIKNMLQIKTAYPFLPALIAKSVSPDKIINIEVLHNERSESQSSYNFLRYFKFSLNLMINYTSFPLTALSVFGFLLSFISIGFGLLILFNRIMDPNYGIIGWNSLMVAFAFLGGTILMGMGIIGEYLRRILAEVSHGQQYVIEEMY